MPSPRAFWPLLLAVVASACRSEPTPGGAPTAAPDSTAVAAGVGAGDREDFYHLAEGSEVIPLNLIRALRSPATGLPFLQDPGRFGLIADNNNPDGLPVGATGDYTVDTRILNVRMLGFNCSACHVNEITYRGTSVRLDGAPSRFYPDSLQNELKASLKHTISSWDAFWQFVRDYHNLEKERSAATAAREPSLLQAPAAISEALYRKLSDADTTAAERAFLAEVRRALAEDSARTPAVNLFDISWDSTDPGHRAFRERYRDGGARAAADGVLRRLLAAHQAEMLGTANLANAPGLPVVRSIADWIIALRLLRDRLATLSQHSPVVASTSVGVGRVDAFGVARNKIYPGTPVPTTAPVSFPHLWGFPVTPWLHYDANTNSVMERNLGQALGVGAIWDRKTYQSTLNPRNIYRLEQIARGLQAPPWPAAFPAVNAQLAQSGRAVFGRECASCHQDRPSADLCYPLAELGTDSLRATNFALPLGNGTFTSAVAPVLGKMKQAAYATFHIPADSQRIMDGIPDSQVVWRTTRMWGARPLAGIWATAPYLHNGSVPNLYELLSPPAQRRATFRLGHTEYDPDSLGYALPGTGSWTYDTRQPGNGNGGHLYGTGLAEPDRLALLEYLKTFTAYGEAVPQHPAAVSCQSLAH